MLSLHPVCVCLFQCSVSCGGGLQQREVNCVGEQDLAVMPNSLCAKISRPETLRKCNMQECKTKTGTKCSICKPTSFLSLAGSYVALKGPIFCNFHFAYCMFSNNDVSPACQ